MSEARVRSRTWDPFSMKLSAVKRSLMCLLLGAPRFPFSMLDSVLSLFWATNCSSCSPLSFFLLCLLW